MMSELLAYWRTRRVGAICLAVITAAFLALRTLAVPISAPTADQSQYLAYAYNMLKHGTFSLNPSDRPRPDQRREPLYPLLLAAGLLAHPGIDLDTTNARCVSKGAGDCLVPVTWIKLVNMVFLGLSGLAVFACILTVTGRPAMAWIGYLWVMFSLSYAAWASRFFPEVVVGFLLVALSLKLWRLAAAPPVRLQWYLTGLLVGAVVLTKATFYYLAPLLALALALHAGRSRAVPPREAALLGMLVICGTLTLTLPWQLRNFLATGSSTLSLRAGLVLGARANFDALPFNEQMAAAALFSPNGSTIRDYLSKRWLTPEIEAKLTGPKNWRNLTYERSAEIRRQGKGRLAPHEIDNLMKREAIDRMRQMWWSHLHATPVIGYRGIFAEHGLGFGMIEEDRGLGEHLFGINLDGWSLRHQLAASLLLFLPAFGAFLYCIATARWRYVFLMLPTAYLYAIQAFMTHYIPRYSAALMPMLVVIAVVSLSAILSLSLRRRPDDEATAADVQMRAGDERGAIGQ